MATRPVYGRVYELVLAGQSDIEHSYVGKTTQTIHQRVHGSSGHTCAAAMARDPWKADIRPGRAGYRLLETVYDTGDPTENARALARAESFWIDRMHPLHNDVRPVRPIGEVRTTVRRQPRPPRTVARATRRRRRKFGKPLALLALVVLFTVLAARLVVAMELPWPQAPWVASPVAGVAVGWVVFWRIHRSVRRLLR